jgi:hypothetical protein
VIVNRCASGNTALCALTTRNAGGALTQIINPNLNLNSLITRGWDLEADWNIPLGGFAGAAHSTLDFHVLATIVKDLITVDSAGASIDRAGQNGSGVSQPSGLPRYTINGYVTYSGGPLSAQLQVRYIPSGRYDVTQVGPGDPGYSTTLPNSISNNHVPAVTYVNVNASFAVWRQGDRRVELFGVVNNLFDKDPPNQIPSSFGPTNNVLYDVLGRFYRAGVRFSF